MYEGRLCQLTAWQSGPGSLLCTDCVLTAWQSKGSCQGRLCTYSLAVNLASVYRVEELPGPKTAKLYKCTYKSGPGSCCVQRVQLETAKLYMLQSTAWQSLGQVPCCVQAVDCVLTAWQYFGPASLLCTRVDCVYSLAVFGPGSLLCMRVDCVLTAWQSFDCQVSFYLERTVQAGSLWPKELYQGRLCTYSLAVFGPGSLLCTG